jgi:hypothetical protein
MARVEAFAKHQSGGATEEGTLNLEVFGQHLSGPFMYGAHDELA